jgi:hypothetical protein
MNTEHDIRSVGFHNLQLKQVASMVVAAHKTALQHRLEDALDLLNRPSSNVGEAILCIRESLDCLQKLGEREYRLA